MLAFSQAETLLEDKCGILSMQAAHFACLSAYCQIFYACKFLTKGAFYVIVFKYSFKPYLFKGLSTGFVVCQMTKSEGFVQAAAGYLVAKKGHRL